MDFGNAAPSDNVLICFNPFHSHIYDVTIQKYIDSSETLNTNTWIHYAITYSSSNTMLMYLNGIQIGSSTGVTLNNIVRTQNYIGKSNWDGDPLINDAIFDEFKIFNRPLNSSEITSEMNKLQPQIIIID